MIALSPMPKGTSRPHRIEAVVGPGVAVHDATVLAFDGTTYRAVTRLALRAGEEASFVVCEGRTVRLES